VLTFEDLDPGYETINVIPAGYHGFQWGSYAYWITKNYHPGSGYDYGTLGHVSLFTAYALPISMGGAPFNFTGAYITAAWDATEQVTVQGWRNGVQVYSTTITTHNDQAYWFSFSFAQVDTVWFVPAGAHLAIDNITYNRGYSWTGVLQPINTDGSSIFKLGSTVPVKFMLTGASAGITDLVAKLYVAKISNNIAGSEAEAASSNPASTGNTFRYDATTGEYIYNLGTKGTSWTAGTYQLRIDLGDGDTTRTVNISLK
jgi:hypothetical protein